VDSIEHWFGVSPDSGSGAPKGPAPAVGKSTPGVPMLPLAAPTPGAAVDDTNDQSAGAAPGTSLELPPAARTDGDMTTVTTEKEE
jgi:hypothetical protein